MKYQYKHISGTFKMILLLCLCGFVFSGISQRPYRECLVVEDITLETATVYIGGGPCADTLIIENMNLRVKRTDCFVNGAGCGSGLRDAWMLPTDTDTLYLSYCRPSAVLFWKKGEDSYQVITDSASMRIFNDIFIPFENNSPRRYACINPEW